MKTYENPIIPGFYPDPSICRAGDNYYLVTSSNEYYPGIPIFHSKDLVHWRQIGHVLDRPSQLNLDGAESTSGIYAPTIRYYDGTFYVICTNATQGIHPRGNFIVTAKDPIGPWSDPYWLEDAPGIDPSLFFDDDGKVYYTGNRPPESGTQFPNHREIWLQQIDVKSMKLIGKKFSLWEGAFRLPNVESPHLYKVNGWYYLVVAERGTGEHHAVSIARSKKPEGPYETNWSNPIITSGNLGWDYPVTSIGHADMVETQNGEWWMVVLGTRPYGDGYYTNLGRETFMVPVKWMQEVLHDKYWPVVNPGVGRVELTHPIPNLPCHPWPLTPACDHFDKTELDYHWNFLRTPREKFWSLCDRPSYLRLKLRPQTSVEFANPSFVGRRQQHMNFAARTLMEFSPETENETAGLLLIKSDKLQYRMVCTKRNIQSVIQLIKCFNGEEVIVTEKPFASKKIYLKIEAFEQNYCFYFSESAEDWKIIGEYMDGRILSQKYLNNFTGIYIGMYASSNGVTSNNFADFDWFEYIGK